MNICIYIYIYPSYMMGSVAGPASGALVSLHGLCLYDSGALVACSAAKQSKGHGKV